MTTYIKMLTADGHSPIQDYSWPLPTQLPDGSWEPGPWVDSGLRRRPTLARTNTCQRAVYGCRPDQLPPWVDAQAWHIELEDATQGTDKVSARRGRLLRPVEGWPDAVRAWRFECAERAVHLHAPAALRRVGLRPQAELLEALAPILDERTAAAAEIVARDTARDAAKEAARATAWDAADAAWAARDTSKDAADAAGAAGAAETANVAAWSARAAWNAARDTARDAAWDAERHWQARRLIELCPDLLCEEQA